MTGPACQSATHWEQLVEVGDASPHLPAPYPREALASSTTGARKRLPQKCFSTIAVPVRTTGRPLSRSWIHLNDIVAVVVESPMSLHRFFHPFSSGLLWHQSLHRMLENRKVGGSTPPLATSVHPAFSLASGQIRLWRDHWLSVRE
jgi:hypothetical protein